MLKGKFLLNFKKPKTRKNTYMQKKRSLYFWNYKKLFMESNEIFQEKSNSKLTSLIKKIGVLLLIALVISYVYISIRFIAS